MLISQKQPYIDHNKQHYTHYKGKQSLRIQHLEKGGRGGGLNLGHYIDIVPAETRIFVRIGKRKK